MRVNIICDPNGTILSITSAWENGLGLALPAQAGHHVVTLDVPELSYHLDDRAVVEQITEVSKRFRVDVARKSLLER
jgi:hypothetical protein